MEAPRSPAQAPAQERRRIEGEVNYIRDQDIWLSDGNIVIIVEDPDDPFMRTFALKCHRSVLARHSQVFNTLFTLPQSPEAEEEYDGAPVVRLSDPYKDLKSLIQMLYDPLTIPTPNNSIAEWQSDLKKISGPLRLTAKYELDGLFSRLSDVLKTHWPVSLDAWTERTRVIRSWKEPYKDGKSKVKLGLVTAPEPLMALDLATICIPSVLPVVFYDLHVRISRQLSDQITALNKPAAPPASHTWESAYSQLNTAQIIQFTRGREWLRLTMTRLAISILPTELRRPHIDAPIARPSCVDAKEFLLKTYMSYMEFNRLNTDPLHMLQSWKETVQMALCSTCASRVSLILEGSRKYIWAEMPYYFGFEERKNGVQHGYEQYLPPDV
ncbi:hypothetical protein BDW22DRAFT_1426440 [Trametopsis cervina]|nr:hypothetical protein BDW22DRAFT_1426440 [Trametopsis cervina]